MPGSVTLITSNYINKETYRERLANLIGDRLTVKSLCINDLENMSGYHDDLVVIVPKSMENRAKIHLMPNTIYILGSFTLALNNIEQVDDIPVGSEVVVLNDVEEYSLEIIDELQALGFTNFQYYTYQEAVRIGKKFVYGITTADKHLMPDLPVLIELGRRQISLSTVGNIFSHFFGQNELDDLIVYRHVANQVNTTLSLYRKIRDNVLLQQRLEAIVSEFEEGVFLFNHDGEIIVANDFATTLLGTAPTPDDILKLIPDEWDFRTRCTVFTQHNDHSLYITLKPLHQQRNTYMAVITDVAAIEYIGYKYKKFQRNTALKAKYTFDDIIAKSTIMADTIKTAKKYSKSDTNILVYGESGTGKELFAQAIHNASSRKNNPFVAINCGALNDSLLESELFGYESGAFTGATKGGKKGLFEIAHTGTIFLDEIGDASLAIQQKLLRAIQEKEFFRVGGTRPIYADVRVISATNKRLLEEIELGTFRRDLFYRLGAMSLYIPPLKDREEDISYLFTVLLKAKLQEAHLPFPAKQFGSKLFQTLKSHPWPGNVRELENLTDVLVNSIRHDVNCSLEKETLEYWNMLYGMSRDIVPQSKTFEKDNVQEKVVITSSEMDVLKILHQLEQKGLPLRNSEVFRHCRIYNIPLSEEQIKLRFNRLRALGFLERGSGYSNFITDSGRKWLTENP